MRPYLAVVSARFRTLLQYRGAAAAGVVTQLLFGLVRLMVLEGFYRSAAGQSFTFAEAVGYVWLGQATFTMLPYNLDREVRALVESGTVAYELVRPVDLYFFWYARTLAWRSAPMLLRSGPMVLVASVGLPLLGLGEWALRLPPSAGAALMWGASMIGALGVSSAISALMSVSLLWSVSGEGVVVLVSSVVTLLSGIVIPLPLFPDWAQPVLRLLPAAAILDLPARIYTGHIPAPAAGWVLIDQLGWTVVLVLIGRAILGRITRRLVIQGG
jgi:ABC-2 type transport system permease protein